MPERKRTIRATRKTKRTQLIALVPKEWGLTDAQLVQLQDKLRTAASTIITKPTLSETVTAIVSPVELS